MPEAVLGCCVIGYLLGNINPAFLFARLKGYDPRVDGSGNAGASNAFILAGKTAFFATAILDLFPALPVAEQIGGAACILGHMFPAVLRFRGGKGLASLGGVILSWDWRAFLALLALAILIAFLTNYICFVAPTMSLLFPALYYARTRYLPAALVLLIPAIPIFFKHAENIRRIREGTEVRMSYLWNKDGELKRTGRS